MKNFCENNAKTGAKTTTKTVKTTTKQCENCKRNLIDRRTHAKTGSFVHPKWVFLFTQKNTKNRKHKLRCEQKTGFLFTKRQKTFSSENARENTKKQQKTKCEQKALFS